MDLTNKSELIFYLKAHNLWTQKKLGQNFLVDKDALGKIVEAAALEESDTVLEIGPGVGTLTYAIAPKIINGLLLAVEKDFKLVELLRQQFKNAQQVKIVHDDIRRFDLCSIEGEYKVVANIPYYLTSPLIRKLLEGKCDPKNLKHEARNSKQIQNFNDRNTKRLIVSDFDIRISDLTINHPPKLIVLTVQKEVAERITAKPGDSNRGVLTVMIELLADAEIIAEIPRASFYPEPAVGSAILRIRPQSTDHGRQTQTVDGGPSTVDHGPVLHVAKAGFSSKRRQLHNSLAGGLGISVNEAKGLLEKTEIDPQKRAEDLTIQAWSSLAQTWLMRYNKSSI